MNIKKFLTVILVFLILFISIGSISASQDLDCDDADLDDDFDLDGYDFDDELLSDEFDWDDDIEFEEEYDYYYSDYDFESNLTDFELLTHSITLYLDRYGNATENWTSSQEFNDEYQIYLSKPSNYVLNNESAGYETYLKIYDSITSMFDVYNLTENETEYLKFMIIFYLNSYGNVSENYTWNESDEFFNFYPNIACVSFLKHVNPVSLSLNYPILNFNSNNVFNYDNITQNNNMTQINIDFPWFIIFILFLVMLLIS